MISPESEQYLKAAIDFSQENTPGAKYERDRLKEDVICNAISVLDAFGIEGDEKIVSHGNPHSSEIRNSYTVRERVTPQAQIELSDGKKVVLVLSEELTGGENGPELESISLRMLDPETQVSIGRKAVIFTDGKFVTNFRGDKASAEDLSQMNSLIDDLYHVLLNYHNPLGTDEDIFNSSESEKQPGELLDEEYKAFMNQLAPSQGLE